MNTAEARVAKVSRWLEWLAIAGLVAVAGLYGAMLLLPAWFVTVVGSMAPGSGPTAISWAQHLALLAITAVALAPMAFVLWHLIRLFRLFGLGEVFAPRPALMLRRIGWGLVAAALAKVLTFTLAVLVITAANPPGQRSLAISLDGGEFAAVLFGALMIVLGWVQGEAARIAAENREIV